MFYNGKEFSGDEWKEFIATILPNCHGLENLYLDDNLNLKIDISVLIENCPHTIVAVVLTIVHALVMGSMLRGESLSISNS